MGRIGWSQILNTVQIIVRNRKRSDYEHTKLLQESQKIEASADAKALHEAFIPFIFLVIVLIP